MLTGTSAWMVDQGMRMPAEAAALILMDGTTSDFSEIAERTSRIMPTLVYANTDALPAAGPGSPRGCRGRTGRNSDPPGLLHRPGALQRST